MIPLTDEDVELVSALSSKGKSVAEISRSLDIPERLVISAQMMATQDITKRAMLEHQLKDIHRLLEIAKAAYEKDPRMSNATAVTAMVNQQQQLISDIAGMADTKELYNRILEVQQNVIRDMLSTTVAAANNLKTALVRAGLSHKVASYHVTNLLKEVQVPSGESYTMAARSVAAILEYENEERAGRVIPLPSLDKSNA